MRIHKLAAAALLGISALGLNACATGFPTQVSRFQAMPAPQGESFIIQSADSMNRGGLEFSRYADLVRRHLLAQGYSEAGPGQGASLIVSLDYGVDGGQEKIVSNSGFGRPGFGRSGYGGFGHPYYSRFGYYGHRRSPFYYGWNDPFWYDPFGHNDVSSYTVYSSYLDMDIRRANGQSVFEGTAKARSRTDQLTALVPNLVEAMFTGFPGNSGETVRITVSPPPRRG